MGMRKMLATEYTLYCTSLYTLFAIVARCLFIEHSPYYSHIFSVIYLYAIKNLS